MADVDALFEPAWRLAERVNSGELGAVELTELSVRRAEGLGGELNAFVEVDAERALAAAAAVRPGDPRPFAGVPIAIKNNRAAAGLRMTFGCRLLADFVAGHDSNVVRRLRDAGFIVIGTTTMPEYGILPVTEATLFGPTLNPWDRSRTPGGSSGGAAAAVAAGIVPVAHGNDGGGSIRIPAACCGLVGLKVQRGRISMAPELAHSLLVVDGVLTRSVADSARILDLLAGPEPGDAYWAPPPSEPFAVAAQRAPERLRIAMSCQSPIAGAEVDGECAAAVAQAAELLRSLGHDVQEVTPPWPQPGMAESFGALFCSYISLSIFFSGLVAGRTPAEQDMEPMSWTIHSMVEKLSAVNGLAVEARLLTYMRSIITFSESYDALLLPALAQRPLPIGSLDTAAESPLDTFTASGHFTPFTALFNATGQPAISLPLFMGEDGLPLAIQLVAAPLREDLLLALAGQLESATGWPDRRPAAL